MSQAEPQTLPTEGKPRPWLRIRAWKIVVILAVLTALVMYFRAEGDNGIKRTTFAARRGPLTISVLEGGNVEAQESQTIKSKIKGETKILTIVDEGYLVTPDDVANGKVLVTLDDSQLIEKMTQETIEYQSAFANFTDAREQYEIQVKQNESDTKAAELAVKFALMDFKKYMGDKLADQIIDNLGLRVDVDTMIKETRAATEKQISATETSSADPAAPPDAADAKKSDSELAGGDLPSDASPKQVAEAEGDSGKMPPVRVEISSSTGETKHVEVDFTKYASPEKLGDGEAQQKLRQLQSSRLIAEEELGLSQVKLAGTRRLAEKNFVTKQELDGDEMTVKKNTISLDAATTDEDLFIKYEFPKEAEQLLSNYEEAIRSLERTIKKGIATEAQAEARWKSSEANFKLRENRMKELQEQLDSCTIRAERTGLVVYAGSDEPWRNRDQIEEGASVYERQEIITIPDMTQMAVKVKIHESSIKKIQKGQKATIKLDSYPDEVLTGTVIKVNVIPDSSSRWMNPDLKLYPAIVAIDGTHDWLKPGMSAQVEIMVEKLKDVVYVPIQAVSQSNGQRVCFVVDSAGRQERRVVETGEFNNEFIEIKKGLKEGEQVLLRAPQTQGAPDKAPGSGDKAKGQPEGAASGGEGQQKAAPNREDRQRPPQGGQA